MPRLQSESFILRTFPLGEQDKLVVFFGRDRGIFKGVAKGARKFGNRFGSSLEPMSHVKVFSYEKEGQELVTVSGCDLLESFFELQTDMEVSFTLGYFAELIEDARPSLTHDDILFRLLLQVLQALKAGGDLKFLTAYFEVWFLKLNGFLPELTRCQSCRSDISGPGRLSPNKDGAHCGNCAPGEHQEMIPRKLRGFLEWTRKNPPAEALPPPLSEEEIGAVRRVRKALIIFHMERSPKSLSFLDKSS
jgi:DNA repair protein RecO (recombination protein O)